MYVPVHDILAFIAYASTEGSDETVHSHSLARALAARTKTKGYTVKTLYNVTRYNRIFNIRHIIAGNGSVSIKIPSL